MKMLVLVTLLALLLFSVWQHAEIVRMGYGVEAMKREKQWLQQRQQALVVEYSRLASYEQIERAAHGSLGMARPAQGRVILVPRGSRTEPMVAVR